MVKSNEQKLVDIMYQVAFATRDEKNKKFFKNKSREEIADWVSKTLTECGFPVSPCGSSWGVLQKEEHRSIKRG